MTLVAGHHGGFKHLLLHRPLSSPGNLLRVDEAIADVEASRAAGILLDLRHLHPRPDTLDSFCLAKHLATTLLGPRLRIALLVTAVNFAEGRFIETVCVNRGGLVRVFRNTVAARAWLRARLERATPPDLSAEAQ